MAKRKTVSVDRMKDIVNTANASIYGNRDQRMGANSLLEMVLHETSNYRGFKYYRSEDLPEKDAYGRPIVPGVIFDSKNHNHTYPDDSRRMYL